MEWKSATSIYNFNAKDIDGNDVSLEKYSGHEPAPEPKIKEFMLQHSDGFIKWNFTKFLVDKNGIPVKRYAPNTEPFSCEKDFEKYW
ncbi:GPX7-like protein [Mya arenaria]|uniref:GPX7-like protein n=1 Tax=Mya arenaria TaxID=6604 RepID=A0ABY7FNR4_MYAAR|nr:GPX7-like protein [Mya arenaria]